jgi:hypothetical protein
MIERRTTARIIRSSSCTNGNGARGYRSRENAENVVAENGRTVRASF